jgi:hypothetical protein
LILASPFALWQHPDMIEFRTLSDEHPDLAHSPLLRAALLTLQYAQEHGAIGLTKTKAFKRVFVHWAVEHFDWPGNSAEDMFRYNKAINEYEFPPIDVLHYLLITLRLGRHYKGEFLLTKRGADLARAPGKLFAEFIPFFVLNLDHAAYARFEGRPFGKWDVWMNVINVEANLGVTERALTEISDRESDIYEKWARLPEPGFHILTRAMVDRSIGEGGGKLGTVANGGHGLDSVARTLAVRPATPGSWLALATSRPTLPAPPFWPGRKGWPRR